MRCRGTFSGRLVSLMLVLLDHKHFSDHDVEVAKIMDMTCCDTIEQLENSTIFRFDPFSTIIILFCSLSIKKSIQYLKESLTSCGQLIRMMLV